MAAVSALRGIEPKQTLGISSSMGGNQGPSNGKPFSLLAIAPADNATQISPKASVAIAFSAPLDPASINSNNFSISAGSRVLEPEIRYSIDFRTVTMSAPLPADTAISVQVSERVRDLWGRALPFFQSQFRTAAARRRAGPIVIAQHPVSGTTGVDPGSKIYLSFDRAIDWYHARETLSVMQNGQPVEGSVKVDKGGTEVEFAPLLAACCRGGCESRLERANNGPV